MSLTKTKNNVIKALILAKQITSDWKSIYDLNHMKLESEKLKYQAKVNNLNKNKLTEDLANLLSAIEESLNDTTHLTNIYDYFDNPKKYLNVKTVLEKTKSEVSSWLSNVQSSIHNDYHSYEEIKSSNGAAPYTKTNLKKVVRLLNKTTANQ